MTATATFENTTAGSENQALLRCPGLGQFRTSAFRVLRLSPAATAKEAVWQCDKTLARVRMGIPLPDPDPAPWLPSADPIEIQEAARTIESPLARIVEQLLWFDPDDENHASLIEALTTADHERLRAYLTASQSSSVAHRVSDANLRLLLGFSRLHEVGPVLVEPASAAPGAKLVRQNRSGPAIVENPHALLRAPVTREVGLATWHGLLGHAVASWGMLLCSPDFVEHVRVKIAALGDELLTDDDLEAVLSGLRTRIADLVVGETRLEIAEGRLDRASLLSSIAAHSNIAAETWLAAFRPLRPLFQAELAELAPHAETGLGVVEDVSAYLDRLTSLARRWWPLDEARLLGLSGLIDDGLQDAFDRLRAQPPRIRRGVRFAEILSRISAIAQSQSLQARIAGYKERLADIESSLCHFCRKRETDVEYMASVTSTRVVSREYRGNTIHTKSQTQARPITRCKHCALLHGYLYQVGQVAFFALLGAVVFFAHAVPSTWLTTLTWGVFGVSALFGIVVLDAITFVVRDMVGAQIIPPDERRFRDYHESKAAKGLRDDGFTRLEYDFRPNAWQVTSRRFSNSS